MSHSACGQVYNAITVFGSDKFMDRVMS